MLDFTFTFEQFTVKIVFFADGDRHLVLNVAEVEGLLFKLLADSLELLGFAIEFRLHIVEVLVQLRDRLLEVVDRLIFEQEFPLLRLNIVL